jgi:restriction system protein
MSGETLYNARRRMRRQLVAGARRRIVQEFATGIGRATANLCLPFTLVGDHRADAVLTGAFLGFLGFLAAFLADGDHPLLLGSSIFVISAASLAWALTPVRADVAVSRDRIGVWWRLWRRLGRHHRLCTWLRERQKADARERQRRQEADMVVNRRRGLLQTDWRRMNGVEFERFVGASLAEVGYSFVRYTPTTGDYGVDLVVRYGGSIIAVQVKHTKRPVGVSAVQEVVAGAAMYGCGETMIVSSGGFTSRAASLARAHRCRMVTIESLHQLLRVRVQEALDQA